MKFTPATTRSPFLNNPSAIVAACSQSRLQRTQIERPSARSWNIGSNALNMQDSTSNTRRTIGQNPILRWPCRDRHRLVPLRRPLRIELPSFGRPRLSPKPSGKFRVSEKKRESRALIVSSPITTNQNDPSSPRTSLTAGTNFGSQGLATSSGFPNEAISTSQPRCRGQTSRRIAPTTTIQPLMTLHAASSVSLIAA